MPDQPDGTQKKYPCSTKTTAGVLVAPVKANVTPSVTLRFPETRKLPGAQPLAELVAVGPGTSDDLDHHVDRTAKRHVAGIVHPPITFVCAIGVRRGQRHRDIRLAGGGNDLAELRGTTAHGIAGHERQPVARAPRTGPDVADAPGLGERLACLDGGAIRNADVGDKGGVIAGTARGATGGGCGIRDLHLTGEHGEEQRSERKRIWNPKVWIGRFSYDVFVSVSEVLAHRP